MLIEIVDSYEAAEEELDKERKHENIGRIAGVIGLIVLVSSTVSPEKTYAYVGSIGVGISSAVVLFGAWAWISPPSKNKNRPSRYFPEIKLKDSSLFEEYKNKVLRPSKKEINQNSRSRSAKLRFAVRNSNKFEYPIELENKFKKLLELEAINV